MRRVLFITIVGIFSLWMSVGVYATITADTTGITQVTHVPRGATGPVLEFTLRSTSTPADTFNSVTVTNDGDGVDFGGGESGIKNVCLHEGLASSLASSPALGCSSTGSITLDAIQTLTAIEEPILLHTR